MLDARTSIKSFLASSARDETMLASANELSTILWAQELNAAIEKGESVVEKMSKEKTEEAMEAREKLNDLLGQLKEARSKVWEDEENVFGAMSVSTILITYVGDELTD